MVQGICRLEFDRSIIITSFFFFEFEMYIPIRLAHEYQESTCARFSNHVNIILFAHANGICRQTFDPIIRKVLRHFNGNGTTTSSPTPSTPLISPVVCVAWDHRGHGDSPLLESDKLPHPSIPYCFSWRTSGKDVNTIIQSCEDRFKGKSISFYGVGHSFGGSCLLQHEIFHRPTFVKFLLIEPMVLSRSTQSIMEVNPLIVSTLKRPNGFSSRQAALDQCLKSKFFQVWDSECLNLYIKYGLRQCPIAGLLKWKCDPVHEAAVFAGDSQFYETFEKLHLVQCDTLILTGQKSAWVHPIGDE